MVNILPKIKKKKKRSEIELSFKKNWNTHRDVYTYIRTRKNLKQLIKSSRINRNITQLLERKKKKRKKYTRHFSTEHYFKLGEKLAVNNSLTNTRIRSFHIEARVPPPGTRYK